MSKVYQGISASTGLAIGPVWLYRPATIQIVRKNNCDPSIEWQRCQSALAKANEQLEQLHQRTSETIGAAEAEIFEAHQMILSDPDFLETIQTNLNTQTYNAEIAIQDSVNTYANMLLALDSTYFQERAQDVLDIGHRLIHILMGVPTDSFELPEKPVIILAEDLSPSDTVQFPRNKILGICTQKGGPTSHTAILSRSLGVPAAVSVPFDWETIQNGQMAILDGAVGSLLLNPSPDQQKTANQRQTAQQTEWEHLLKHAAEPANTSDGKTIEVVANIGSADDARHALTLGAEGVGLLRTEFLYLNRESMPTEAEQTQVYREIFEIMGNRPVVVRTLDIGGDKAVPYIGFEEEANPFLGWRAIRMADNQPDLLRIQFRALLRAASAETDLRIMIPMISNADEIKMARNLLNQAKQELQNEKIDTPETVQFGIMVEIPAAAIQARELADLVDFFSIGTNDLTQYALAVDRTNERVAHLASPFHPAVLRLIRMTIEGAHVKGKWVGLCGEMAGDPLAAPVLLGLGLDEFSMAASSIPGLKETIRQLDSQQCKDVANTVCELLTAQDVKAYLQKLL
ncbi:MAG: phosphoenolpyruvate--protein phosphotransferase [Anaerolineaceae bacterium]|nr:phosphoenolpyruvate--protein phosphotransferase [Anaerolineaceae bacterium]